jgi:hypothetical protein
MSQCTPHPAQQLKKRENTPQKEEEEEETCRGEISHLV